jgi:hypothetical protein
LVIRRAGFVDLAAVPIPLSDQGDRLANAILNAGLEILLAELQRMIGLLSPRVHMSSTFRFDSASTRLDVQSRSNVMQLAQAIRDRRLGGRKLMLLDLATDAALQQQTAICLPPAPKPCAEIKPVHLAGVFQQTWRLIPLHSGRHNQ